MLKYQDQEWAIVQAIERNKKGANIPIPDWYNEKVGVPEHLRWFWSAFWELDTERQTIDGVPRRIPWSKALQYAQYHKINFDYLWHLVVVLDNMYIEHKVEARQKEIDDMKRKAAKSPKKGKRRGSD